jgi:hypothetical protein
MPRPEWAELKKSGSLSWMKIFELCDLNCAYV